MNDAAVSTIGREKDVPPIEAAFQAQDYQLSTLEQDALASLEANLMNLSQRLKPVRTNPTTDALVNAGGGTPAADLDQRAVSTLTRGLHEGNERLISINDRVMSMASFVERLIVDIEL